MSLKPAKYNFTAYEGATFRKRITYYSAGVGSPAVDLSGYTASMPVKDKANGTTLFTFSSPTTIFLGGSAGTIELVMDVATVNAQAWTQGLYELFVTAPAGDTDILLHGGFKVITF